MSKCVDEINSHSITISIQRDGKAVHLSPKDKELIINAIKRTLANKLKGNDSLQILILSDKTAIFQRGKRHKRFTPEQAKEIKEDNSLLMSIKNWATCWSNFRPPKHKKISRSLFALQVPV